MTMKLKTNSCKPQSAVALVITLLMLAVITFLAIAFLAMTSRDKSAVTASLDYGIAKSMSDSALARAQAEIVSRMMASNDILSYDYMASHAFLNSGGYTAEAFYDPYNVNYDTLITNGGSQNANWVSNIANLFYDPRPPVFIQTNPNPSLAYDFRFYVDLNRNGRFETNGIINTIDPTDTVIGISNTLVNGEPEWIGVLKYPETNHSIFNPFIGRYAYMVLPIGKTLDFNYIYNHSKFSSGGGGNDPNMKADGFIRDQGVGPWELNLAALINDLGPMFQTNQLAGYGTFGGNGYFGNPYSYQPNLNVPPVAPMGAVNFDATQILGYRYGYQQTFPPTLAVSLMNPAYSLVSNIDEYGIYPLTSPNTFGQLDYVGYPALDMTKYPWPNTYSSNMFYDIQDLFDASKVGSNFATNLFMAGTNIDTINRYTFQRLLGSIGMGSEPEYAVYVYSNLSITGSTLIPTGVPPPSVLRTKVNLNYDNTAQILTGPYTSYGAYNPMPTNLVAWTPLGFFTNAAESLLRSQIFVFTNYVTNSLGQTYVPIGTASNYIYTNFDLTNIPVYVATNPGIVYSEQVHRMLQLAANIYASVYPSNLSGVPQPPVFRPQFKIIKDPTGTSNALVLITNFVQVTGTTAYNQISKGFFDFTNLNAATVADPNFWGVPWVVGAVKGIPEFDQFSYQDQIYCARQLQFVRYPNPTNAALGDTARPPHYTNQYMMFSISNIYGMDAWNPYNTPFVGSSGSGVYAGAYFDTVITLTNNALPPYNWGTNIKVTNVVYALTNQVASAANPWQGWYNPVSGSAQTSMFKTLLPTTFVALPPGYVSEFSTPKQFVPFTNGVAFLPVDTNQTIYPTHYWSVSVTNHAYYILFDGTPGAGNVLDFVNLGPFGGVFPLTQDLVDPAFGNQFSKFPYSTSMWTVTPATDGGSSQISLGVLSEISNAFNLSGGITFEQSLLGKSGGYPAKTVTFQPPSFPPNAFNGQATTAFPYANYVNSNIWMACDPLVHYTVGDLFSPSTTTPSSSNMDLQQIQLSTPMKLSIGHVTTRYSPWGFTSGSVPQGNMLFMDPLISSANAWQFPSNQLATVGLLGRVHRGTPWQTIYLKADNPKAEANPFADWVTQWVNSPWTYPTNDWSLIDLFTAVPNDNAARGLLSVNQTNGAAWAAVFSGVIAWTNYNGGIAISPINDGVYNFYSNAVDSVIGINATRSTNRDGLFHHVGDILQSSALTTQSPFVTAFTSATSLPPTDEMVERIPQQTLGLLKVGLPQFVIYAWGQSLRPKNLYSGSAANLVDICTNYEITGEYLTRTVCHLVTPDGTPNAPRIVVDSFNIEPNP